MRFLSIFLLFAWSTSNAYILGNGNYSASGRSCKWQINVGSTVIPDKGVATIIVKFLGSNCQENQQQHVFRLQTDGSYVSENDNRLNFSSTADNAILTGSGHVFFRDMQTCN